MLGNNSNVIFLITATGGNLGDLSTSYDMQYFKKINCGMLMNPVKVHLRK